MYSIYFIFNYNKQFDDMSIAFAKVATFLNLKKKM